MEAKPRIAHWKWMLAVIGLLLGVVDTLIIQALGIRMALNDMDVTVFVGAYFTLSFIGLGYIIGHLLATRKALHHANQKISQQMTTLEETRKQALQNEQLAAVGRMAAGVAHEVRNPLGIIRSSAGLIYEDPSVGEDSRKAAHFIGDEVDRLNDFVTRLLDFTKPILPRMETVDLSETAQAAVDLLEEQIKEKEIDVRIQNQSQVTTVTADLDLLSRALLSLLVNAVQVLEKAGIIEIRFSKQSQDLLLEVADSGPGVPEEMSEDILKPFVTTKPKGTGLGLPMASRIAEAHGGALEVCSGMGAGIQGAGATFRLRLPLVAVNS